MATPTSKNKKRFSFGKDKVICENAHSCDKKCMHKEQHLPDHHCGNLCETGKYDKDELNYQCVNQRIFLKKLREHKKQIIFDKLSGNCPSKSPDGLCYINNSNLNVEKFTFVIECDVDLCPVFAMFKTLLNLMQDSADDDLTEILINEL